MGSKNRLFSRIIRQFNNDLTIKTESLETEAQVTTATVSTQVDSAVAALVSTAPAALDTLDELAAALGDDANFATTVTNSLATKIDSAGVLGLIDSAYVSSRVEAGGSGITVYDSAGLLPPSGNTIGNQGFVPTTNVLYIWNGTTWAYAALNVPEGDEDYQPSGTTREFLATFNGATSGISSSYASVVVNNEVVLTKSETGGVQGGYWAGWSTNNYISMTRNSLAGRSYVAWIRTTSSVAPATYDPGMPIFGDTSNSRYTSLGISNGKIDVGNSNAYSAGSNDVTVNDGSWHLLVWVCSAQQSCVGYVDGVQKFSITGFGSSAFNAINAIGRSYSNSANGVDLDGVQIYNSVLSANQVLEIWNASKDAV